MSDWFINHRIEWIRETIIIYGFINRVHIERKFGVSTGQAASDLAAAQERYPDLMHYNKVSKRYEFIE
jgi:hypothetical protein